MLVTLFYFLLALLLLVTIHEYGHFQVARWCGVKVLRFSFGFGAILARWHDKKGTEYVLSAFPLGGYVSMLDESEGEVHEQEKHLAFNNKPLWVRCAVVLAGPLFNFLFAFIALWLVLVLGMSSLAPIVGKVEPNSIAMKAGFRPEQEIITLDGVTINNWRDFQYTMMRLIGSEKSVVVTVKSLHDGRKSHLVVPLTHWHLESSKRDPLQSLGIEPFIPTIPPLIGEIVPDSPAAQIGLQVNDTLIAVDGVASDDWTFFVSYIKAHPHKEIMLQITRNGKTQQMRVLTGRQINQNKVEGFLGVRSQKIQWPAHWLRWEREDPITAVATALKQTVQFSAVTVSLIGKLITGRLGLKSISGPVGIAQGAGESGRQGLVYYLFFLAMVSISLGVLNLLPIPMLDGGHLLYYALEIIRRKPLSANLKSAGVYAGVFVLFTLMCIALTNDISRLGS